MGTNEGELMADHPTLTPEQKTAIEAYATQRAFIRAINCMKAMNTDQVDIDLISNVLRDIQKPAEPVKEKKPDAD
jgi:hypothetical protein